MKSKHIVLTTVLTTLTVLAFVGAFAWSVSPAAAIAGSLHASHSAPDGDHCARLSEEHTELIDAYLRITLDLDDSQQQALAPVIGVIEAWRVDAVATCENADFTNVDSSLATMQAMLGLTETAIAELRPAVGAFQAGLSPEQQAELTALLSHHHGKRRAHDWH